MASISPELLQKLKQHVGKKSSKKKKKTTTKHLTKEQVDKMLADLPPAEDRAVQRERYREAGQTIKAVARAFRLKFNDLSKSRKIKGDAAHKLAGSVDCDPSHLRFTKVLYAKHPSIHAVQVAKAKLIKYWQSKTLKYPEDGVRLFGVRGETEQDQNEEVRVFLDEINDLISDFRQAIDELANNWSEVMATCRERLRELHDESDYPTSERLHQEIGVGFETYNFELPEYLKAVNPAEYRRQQARLNAQFTEVAEKQAELIEEAMAMGLQQMVSSIRGWQDGTQKSFKDGVIERVFKAIEEYKSKIEPFGILNGRQIGAQFEELHNVLKGVGEDATTVANRLRKDGTQREFVLGRMDELFTSIMGMSSETTRRKVLRPDPVPAEEPSDKETETAEAA
jgi:hypothetical protein